MRVQAMGTALQSSTCEGRELKAQEYCTYTCAAGYRASGDGVLWCGMSGVLEDERCLKDCPFDSSVDLPADARASGCPDTIPSGGDCPFFCEGSSPEYGPSGDGAILCTDGALETSERCVLLAGCVDAAAAAVSLPGVVSSSCGQSMSAGDVCEATCETDDGLIIEVVCSDDGILEPLTEDCGVTVTTESTASITTAPDDEALRPCEEATTETLSPGEVAALLDVDAATVGDLICVAEFDCALSCAAGHEFGSDVTVDSQLRASVPCGAAMSGGIVPIDSSDAPACVPSKCRTATLRIPGSTSTNCTDADMAHGELCTFSCAFGLLPLPPHYVDGRLTCSFGRLGPPPAGASYDQSPPPVASCVGRVSVLNGTYGAPSRLSAAGGDSDALDGLSLQFPLAIAVRPVAGSGLFSSSFGATELTQLTKDVAAICGSACTATSNGVRPESASGGYGGGSAGAWFEVGMLLRKSSRHSDVDGSVDGAAAFLLDSMSGVEARAKETYRTHTKSYIHMCMYQYTAALLLHNIPVKRDVACNC